MITYGQTAQMGQMVGQDLGALATWRSRAKATARRDVAEASAQMRSDVEAAAGDIRRGGLQLELEGQQLRTESRRSITHALGTTLGVIHGR